MNHYSVELQSVSKVFEHAGARWERVVAVDDVSIQLRKGELLTLLGPSGCGKTTTLRMIGGFEIPTRGDVLLEGKVITNLPPNRRDTAMVFQSYALFPHMTVFENVAYGLRMRKMGAGEIEDRVGRALTLVGLDGMERRPPGALSGGQQQRVALARALVVERTHFCSMNRSQSRRQAKGTDAHRDPEDTTVAGHHKRVCHPRPGRGNGPI